MRRSWICATSCCNFTFVDFLKLDVSTGKSWLQGTGLEAPTCGRWGMRWSALLPLQIPSVSQCWVTIMAVACICIPEMFASCRTTAIWLQIRYECRFGDMILCSKVREAYEATQCLCASWNWNAEMLKCHEVFQYLPILQWNELLRVASICLLEVGFRGKKRDTPTDMEKLLGGTGSGHGLHRSPCHVMPCPCPLWGDAARVRRIAKVEQVGKSMEIFQNLRKAYDHMDPYGSI